MFLVGDVRALKQAIMMSLSVQFQVYHLFEMRSFNARHKQTGNKIFSIMSTYLQSLLVFYLEVGK